MKINKLKLATIALGLIAFVGNSSAQTAVSDPVGYVSIGDTTPAADAVPTGSDVTFSVPLDNKASASGTVDSVAGSVVTFSGSPGFTVSQFVPGAPGDAQYLLKVESGSLSGLQALITANDASTVTVTLQAGDSLTGLAAGDSLTIRQAWTLSTLFDGAAMPDGVEVFAYDGATSGINIAPSQVYAEFGGNWFDTVTFSNADDVVLFSGESFVMRNNTGTNISSLVIAGSVPTSNSRALVQKITAGVAQDTRISYVSPVNEVIGNSGLGFSDGDELLVFDNSVAGVNKSASQVLSYFGGAWYDSVTFVDVTSSFELEGGKGYVYRRVGTAAVGDTVHQNDPDYVAGL